jgi:hypothetical protein
LGSSFAEKINKIGAETEELWPKNSIFPQNSVPYPVLEKTDGAWATGAKCQ